MCWQVQVFIKVGSFLRRAIQLKIFGIEHVAETVLRVHQFVYSSVFVVLKQTQSVSYYLQEAFVHVLELGLKGFLNRCENQRLSCSTLLV